MKTLLLDPEPAADFALLGLVSAAPGFRLAWWLNEVLGSRLRRVPDFVLDLGPRGGRLVIGRFVHETTHGLLRLLKNRALEPTAHGAPFLAPELAQFDFLLQISGLWAAADLAPWVATLRQVPLIHYVCSFEPAHLRSRAHFWELDA